MRLVCPSELQQLLAGNPNLALLDVRTPAEFAAVHIPGARNEPLGDLKPEALYESGLLSRGQSVYLLCKSGGRATKAAQQFAACGYDCAVVVEGGTEAWIAAGLPVNRGAASGMSLERQVRIAAGSLVLAGVLLGWLLHPGFFGLAAFVGAGLVFAGITDFCGMGLLLAKMPWNRR